MSIARLSSRYNDIVDEHGENLAALVHSVTALARSPQPASDDAARLAALGSRLLSTFEAVRQQAGAVDDAMRAIGAIARAGRDTPKVRRVLREIVMDQTRMASTERKEATSNDSHATT